MTEQWEARYYGPANNDFIRSIVLDVNGNILVSGSSSNLINGFDIATICFSQSGVQVWAARYNTSFPNSGSLINSLVSDKFGNVFVSGSTPIQSVNVIDKSTTIKYNQSGYQCWLSRYYGAGNWGQYSNEANSVCVDRNDNVIVTGFSYFDTTGADFVTLKYDSAGNQQWVARYRNLGPDYTAIKVLTDSLGYIYVTGSITGDTTGYDIATLKYSPAGEQLWVARYNGPANGGDSAMAMTLDMQGNVYVTGRSWGGQNTKYDYVTIKYNTNGVQQWATRYDRNVLDNDIPHAIAVDDFGNVYVTGESIQVNHTSTSLTIKYDPNGNELWERSYEYQFGDYSKHLVLDKMGYVYVGDDSQESMRSHAAIVKYSPQGDKMWTVRTQSALGESISGLAVDSSFNVYLAASDGHYLVIKYSQVIGIQPISNEVTKGFSLKQNYPNPFNPSTNIEFSVPKSSFVTLKVYDALGREVRSLVNENLVAGTYRAQFEASNLASGMYYYKMTAIDEATKSSFVETKPMVLVK